MRQVAAVEEVLAKIPTEACVRWPGQMGRDGYGSARIGHRRVVAHRFIYALVVGEIKNGLQLDHLCRVRDCVNPSHLEPVTPAENTARVRDRVAGVDSRTHCVNGHSMTPENTYRKPNGHRDCRACIRVRVASYKARRAA